MLYQLSYAHQRGSNDSTLEWAVKDRAGRGQLGILSGYCARYARGKAEKMFRTRSSVLIFGTEGNEDGCRLR